MTSPDDNNIEQPARHADGSDDVVTSREDDVDTSREHEVVTSQENEQATQVVEDVLGARRARADRATRGTLAALLCLEAVIVLLVPRAIAQTHTGLDTTKTVILVALAVVLIVTGFLLRRPFGIGLGSALQVAVLATAVLESVMLIVAAIFIGLWLWILTMRRDLVGTPGGLRLLRS